MRSSQSIAIMKSISDSTRVEGIERKAAIGLAGPTRIDALDFTKGALVLFMVLYHWLNYFFGPHGQYYDYLKFLTPSFIFITGFMISQIQLRRYENSGRSLPKRLFVRGLKLLALFLVLNAIVYALPSRFRVPFSLWGESLRNFSWAA